MPDANWSGRILLIASCTCMLSIGYVIFMGFALGVGGGFGGSRGGVGVPLLGPVGVENVVIGRTVPGGSGGAGGMVSEIG